MTPFWRFWTASAISQLGSGVTAVALPLTAIILLDATAWQVGLVTAASFIGWAVLGLPAGVICSYLPLRLLQGVTDLIRAAAIISVPLAWAWGGLTVTQLVVVATVMSLCTVVFDVGNSTFLPAIVPADQLASRNSWMSGLGSTTQLGGPAIAGLVVQTFGPAYALLVDGISFVASALVLQTLPPRSPAKPQQSPQLRAMIKDGWNFVVKHPVMRACLLDATASNFVGGALLALGPLYLLRDLGASPFLVGLLLAGEGVGGVIGAVLSSRVSAALGSARAALWGSVARCVAALALPLGDGVPGMLLFAVGSLGFAAGAAVTSINTRTYRQLASPPELLSRVVATVRFVSWGVIPVGSLIAGALAGVVGARTSLLFFCLLAWLSPLVLVLSPVRRMREFDLSPTEHLMESHVA